MALATTDTGIVIDLRLPVLLEMDGVLRAVHITTAGNATATEVRDLIIDRDT